MREQFNTSWQISLTIYRLVRYLHRYRECILLFRNGKKRKEKGEREREKKKQFQGNMTDELAKKRSTCTRLKLIIAEV